MPPNAPVAAPNKTRALNAFVLFLNPKLFPSTVAKPNTPVNPTANKTLQMDALTKLFMVDFSEDDGW